MMRKDLKQYAAISRGAPKGRMEDARDESLDVAVVQPANLGPLGIVGELTVTTVAKFKLETYQLQLGDVLVSLLDPPDAPLRVGLVTSDSLGKSLSVIGRYGARALVAGANVAVVRLRTQQLNPYYLALYLRSQDAALQLRVARGGSAQSYLNIVALGKVKIPVPPLEEQWRAADLHDSYERYALETQRLLSAERQLMEARFDQWVGATAHG